MVDDAVLSSLKYSFVESASILRNHAEAGGVAVVEEAMDEQEDYGVTINLVVAENVRITRGIDGSARVSQFKYAIRIGGVVGARDTDR